jgi:hypothetical protein
MKLDVLQGAESSEPPLTGRSARLMMLDEKYVAKYILHPRGLRLHDIEMQSLGECFGRLCMPFLVFGFAHSCVAGMTRTVGPASLVSSGSRGTELGVLSQSLLPEK